ncbi:MAG: restriction endonuclease subunit R, partial [Bergeyella sp.]
VTKAQHNYNRIEGYSKEETENGEYWKSQLPFYQKSIDAAKVLVQEKIAELSEKGVNVAEIEHQTKATNDRIAELDAKLEELPEVRAGLVSQYKEEKEQQTTDNMIRNYVKEREAENVSLFKKSDFDEANSPLIHQNQSENEVREETVSFQRKR